MNTSLHNDYITPSHMIDNPSCNRRNSMDLIVGTLFQAFEEDRLHCLVGLDDKSLQSLDCNSNNFDPIPLSFSSPPPTKLLATVTDGSIETGPKFSLPPPPPMSGLAQTVSLGSLPSTDNSSFIPAVNLRKAHNKNEPMPVDFRPGAYDIICGDRSKSSLNHVGNRRFKLMMQMHVEKYKNSPTKVDKSLVVISIVDAIRDLNGHFVRRDKASGMWHDIGDQLAREKVGYALRDNIVSKKRRTKKASKTNQ